MAGVFRRGLVGCAALFAAVSGVVLFETPGAFAADVVVARTADLKKRVADAGTGQLRIASATVRQDRVRNRAQATVTLDAAPDGTSPATLVVAFGPVDGGVCQLNDFLDANQYATPISGDPAAGWSRNGRTFRLDLADEAAGYQPWECAGAVMVVGNENVSFLADDLRDIFMKPKLKVERPMILNRTVKGALALVKGKPHVVRFPVRSLNQADAKRVVVSGSGRGLKVSGSKLGTVYGNGTSSVRMVIRARGRKLGPLRIRVSSANGKVATRVVKVRARRAPAKPRPGRYRSPDGDVDFTITRGGKVKGFRIYTRTRCGGYGDFPTYTNNYYSFPTAPIDGGGVVDGSQRTKLYVVSLGLKAIGRKVTQGSFGYSVLQAPCSASDSFTARWIGR